MEMVLVNGVERYRKSALPEEMPGTWSLEILMKKALVKTNVISFFVQGSPHLEIKIDTDHLVCSLQFDSKSTPLQLKAHLSLFLTEKENSLLLCNRGNRLSLYVNGLLIDEEWPLGNCILAQASVQSNSDVVAYAVIMDSFEKEDSLRSVIERDFFTGPAQYWKPSGYDTRVGDCMPFYLDGRFHLYYLLDRHGHKSKWGLGAHQWAHISTTDFLQWDIHPLAIPITEQWEGSICTGSVLYENGKWYAFYAVRMSDFSPARLTWAVSDNGFQYNKTGQYFSLAEPYDLVSARDPKVFKDQAGIFHMLVTTSLVHSPDNLKDGCLAHLVSTDLEQWEQVEPFIVPGYSDQPECSDYFYLNGWYYLIFSNYGAAKYRKSRFPFGPWLKPRVDRIDGPAYRVPKTALLPDGRIIAAGFLAKKPDEYAGCVIFRELFQMKDGDLGTRFLEHVMPGTDESIDQDDISVNGTSGYELLERPLGFVNFLLSLEIYPQNSSLYYGLVLSDPSLKQGWELRFEPDDRKVGFHKLGVPFLSQDEQTSLYNVDGLAETVSLKIVVVDNIVDLMVNGERTMALRLDRPEGGYSTISFFTMAGEAEFRHIRLSPLHSKS